MWIGRKMINLNATEQFDVVIGIVRPGLPGDWLHHSPPIERSTL